MFTQLVPLLLLILVGLVLSTIAGAYVRSRGPDLEDAWAARDDMLLGLLVLASVGVGVFSAYILLGH